MRFSCLFTINTWKIKFYDKWKQKTMKFTIFSKIIILDSITRKPFLFSFIKICFWPHTGSEKCEIYCIALDCNIFHIFFSLCSFAQRAVAALDNEETKIQTQRHGHKGILTVDQGCKMETVTTVKAAYIPPKDPGVRLRGMCLCQSPSTVWNCSISSNVNIIHL